jgi:hypothetical protein
MPSGEIIAIHCENHVKHEQAYMAFQKLWFILFKEVVHVSIYVCICVYIASLIPVYLSDTCDF